MKICSFSKTYQERITLDFPDFSFQEGTVYAIIGANGCGKSTFAKILSGTLRADEPDQKIIDRNLSVGYLPQKPYAFHMTLLQNVLLNSSDDKKESLRRAKSLIEDLQLSHLSTKKAASLSGGETARMALARLMMKDYDVLILDEPCAAMDIASTLQTEKMIRDYCTRTNSVVLLITHSLQQAARTSDELLFFSEGKLLEHGKTDIVLHHPTYEKTCQYLDFFRTV